MSEELHPVESCPGDADSWLKAGIRLNCSNDILGNNLYHCVPNEDKNDLVEFCTQGSIGRIGEGLCLFAYQNRYIDVNDCEQFVSGCPENSYISNEIYNYPACLEINREAGCYLSDPDCPPLYRTTLGFTGSSVSPETIIATVTIIVYLLVFIAVGLFFWCRRRRRRRNQENARKEWHVKSNSGEESVPLESTNEKTNDYPSAIESTNEKTNDHRFAIESTNEKTNDHPSESAKECTPSRRHVDVDHLEDNKRYPIQSKCARLAVAAIDFGTTCSGYAFSWKHEWEKVQVGCWNCGVCLSNKIPTALLLKPDKSFYAFGFEAETLFTSMSNTQSDSDDDEEEGPKENRKDYYYFHRFSTVLHKDQGMHRDTEIKDITGKKMKAMEIFSVCIKYMKDYILKRIKADVVEEIFVKDIDYVLTVPAIWGDVSKMFMREAAVNAGIPSDQISIALEPAAASIYCQYMYLENNKYEEGRDSTFQDQVEQKSKYMVVDLGGSTADITVHKDADDGTFEEWIPVTREPLGGTSVDEEFADFLETIGGKGVLGKLKEDHLSLFENFEEKKRGYNGTKVRIKIPIRLAMLIKKDNTKGSISQSLQNTKYKDQVIYVNNKLTLESSVFEEFFKRAVDGISKSIKNILSDKSFADVRTIIMVGGFSECSLIQNAIKKQFSSHRIIIPDEAGIAVLKGAVYFGHVPNN